MSGDVKWHGQRVRGEVQAATRAAIAKLAFDIEAGAKAQITDNQQIDTGFMRNSTYTVTKDHGVRAGAGAGVAGREAASPQPLGDADAIVGVGAVYAIYNEVKKSFLRVAFERVIGAAGGTFKRTFGERGF
jgi:hypothetical protein